MQLSSAHPAAAVLAAVLAEQGVRHAVASPGSRNAPLVLALHHQPGIKVHVSIDERAAAHHALGLALATWTPVPVVCTSGTAALNHGPALAEAFHARIPLLSITADRPADAIGRGHGQTIAQAGVHAAHTVHHDVLDASCMDLAELTSRVRRAVRLAFEGGPGGASGPVHLNVPFEEPLYDLAPAPNLPPERSPLTGLTNTQERPENHAVGNPDSSESAASPEDVLAQLPPRLRDAVERGRVVVVAGPRPRAASRSASARLRVNLPCLAERGAAVEGPLVIHGAERVLRNGTWPEALQPEAVLTLGLPPMSKELRQSLAGLPQWHVGEDLPGEGAGWDIWGTLQGGVSQNALTCLSPDIAHPSWKAVQTHLDRLASTPATTWSDLAAWQCLVHTWKAWPETARPSALHVANSASARYAQWVNLRDGLQRNAVTHANRGVAGIDGCTSTALGWHAGRGSQPDTPHPGLAPATWLVTGDVAFHYDANAFLTDPSLIAEGLKIVVMNNGGGGIFRWLPGTQHRDVFERHFETPPARSVEAAAHAARATYLCATNATEMPQALEQLRDAPGLAFLEVITPNVESGDEAKRHLQACKEGLTF